MSEVTCTDVYVHVHMNARVQDTLLVTSRTLHYSVAGGRRRTGHLIYKRGPRRVHS